MSGKLGEAQAGAFLMGLRAKGEDSTDLASGVRAGVSHAVKIPGYDGDRDEPVIDTCGTGGDGQCSFNNSTAVSLFPGGHGVRRGQARQPRPVLLLRFGRRPGGPGRAA